MRLNQEVTVYIENIHKYRNARIIAKRRFGKVFIVQDCMGQVWRLDKEDVFPIFSKNPEIWKKVEQEDVYE